MKSLGRRGFSTAMGMLTLLILAVGLSSCADVKVIDVQQKPDGTFIVEADDASGWAGFGDLLNADRRKALQFCEARGQTVEEITNTQEGASFMGRAVELFFRCVASAAS